MRDLDEKTAKQRREIAPLCATNPKSLPRASVMTSSSELP
jgi:hypothetical protein